jgi:tetratricopeptide (TPR) repeat protein
LERALPLLEETLNLEMAKLGPLHEYTLTTMNNLALACQEAGKLDRALPLLEETFKLSKANLGPEHRNTRRAMNDLGVAYLEAGKLDQALPLLQEALKSRRAMLGREHPNTLITLANLGKCLLRQGSYTNAEALARECFELRERATPNDWRTFAVQTTLGMALLGQKKYDGAESFLVQSYVGLKEGKRKIPAASCGHLREAAQGLVQLYDATGCAEKATEWKQKLAEFEQAETDKQPASPPR